VDTDGDGEADAEYENYDDIPCGALIEQLDYICPNCGESVGIGEEYKPHTYTSVYLVDGKECDYDDIPCGTVYTEKYTCESCGDSYEIEWEKLHEVPDDAISTEDSAKCGEIYTISYTCPQCKQNIVEEFEKEHSFELSYVYVADGKAVDDYSDLACEEEYVTTYTCSVCGYSYSDEAETKAHEPDDEVVYYDEDGSEVDISDLKCEKEYTMEFVCGLCGEAVSQPFALDHEPGEDGTFYAAANVTSTDDEKGASFDVVGAYTNDLDNIGCGTWYVEKFTCVYCNEEIVQLASYKDHQWETVDGEEVCSVCGNEGEDKGEADTLTLANFDNRTNDSASIQITDTVGGTFTVTCGSACVVAYLDENSNYVRMTATATSDATTYSFVLPETAMTDNLTVVVVIKGDTSLDGEIKQADATQAKAAFLGKRTLTEIQLLAADVTGDGELKQADATQIKATFLGKRTLNWDI
jgi:hypothetical protein